MIEPTTLREDAEKFAEFIVENYPDAKEWHDPVRRAAWYIGYGFVAAVNNERNEIVALLAARPVERPGLGVLPFYFNEGGKNLHVDLWCDVSGDDRARLRLNAGAWDREEPTQLDQLAHAVLAQTLADLVESGRDVQTEAEDRAEVIARLRNDPMGSFNRGVSGANWADWMRSYFTRLLPLFEEALARRGLTLSAPGAWLRVLRAYAFSPFDLSVRRACLDWLTGQPLEPADLEALGLKPAEAPNVEADPSETNEACRHRVMDLCQLAVFHRPFVFCFDQTEVYGHRAPLARAFGMALGRLVDEAANQLTLVTSNQSPWTERIAPNLETADLDRIAKPFLTLKGLNRDQGAELARLRMEAAGITPERQAAFLGDKWLAEIFPAQTNELGARHFLQKCRERWNRAPSRDVPLKELFQEEREKLLAAPKRHLFEPDTLQWLIEEAARGVDGIVVKSLTDRYFSVCWQTTHGICYFGFVSGSFWRQWRAIARAALADCGTNPRPAKAVFFRTPEQTPIPGATWQVADEIEAAKARCLQIIALRVEDVAELYAGKELFAGAAQGDIPYSMEEVLKFLAVELAPWWDRLRAPMVPARDGEEQG